MNPFLTMEHEPATDLWRSAKVDHPTPSVRTADATGGRLPQRCSSPGAPRGSASRRPPPSRLGSSPLSCGAFLSWSGLFLGRPDSHSLWISFARSRQPSDRGVGKAALGCADGRGDPRQVSAPCDAGCNPGKELPDQGLAVCIATRGQKRQIEGTAHRRGRELRFAAGPG